MSEIFHLLNIPPTHCANVTTSNSVVLFWSNRVFLIAPFRLESSIVLTWHYSPSINKESRSVVLSAHPWLLFGTCPNFHIFCDARPDGPRGRNSHLSHSSNVSAKYTLLFTVSCFESSGTPVTIGCLRFVVYVQEFIFSISRRSIYYLPHHLINNTENLS